MPSLEELLKSSSYEEALEKLAQGPPTPGVLARMQASGTNLANQAQQQFDTNPYVRNSLIGAGIGAAGLGVGSALFGDRKKRSLLTDLLSGAALGGAGGLGYSMFNHTPTANRNPAVIGQADAAAGDLRNTMAYRNRRQAAGDDGTPAALARNPLNLPGRMWDRWWTRGADTRDAVGAGAGAAGGIGMRVFANHLDRNVVNALPQTFARDVVPQMTAAANSTVAQTLRAAGPSGVANSAAQRVGELGAQGLARTNRFSPWLRGGSYVMPLLGLGIAEATRPDSSITIQQQANELNRLTNQLQ